MRCFSEQASGTLCYGGADAGGQLLKSHSQSSSSRNLSGLLNPNPISPIIIVRTTEEACSTSCEPRVVVAWNSVSHRRGRFPGLAHFFLSTWQPARGENSTGAPAAVALARRQHSLSTMNTFPKLPVFSRHWPGIAQNLLGGPFPDYKLGNPDLKPQNPCLKNSIDPSYQAL